MSDLIEVRHLRYFVALADELHFGRAARALGISQPALSQQIKQLETALGAVLLDRTSRSVRLTPAGELFRSRAMRLLQRLADDAEEVAEVSRGQVGRLDVAFISSAAEMVSDALAEFAAAQPKVRVRLHECFTDDALDRLARTGADVVIVRDPDARAGVSLSPVFDEPFTAVVPRRHPLAERTSVTADDLAPYPLILFPARAGARAHAANTLPFREIGAGIEVAHTCSSWSTIFHLVAAGLGVSVAPNSATNLLPPRARRLHLTGTTARSHVEIATRTGDTRLIVEQFVGSVSGVRPSHVAPQPEAPGASLVGDHCAR